MDSESCFSLNRFRRRGSSKNNGPSPGIPEAVCRRFSLADIKRATDCFHPDKMIGDGGFGTVYKGCLDEDMTTQVAIKRWNPHTSIQGRSEFWKEAELCCQLRHPNLVAFKGFCYEHDEMIRVYEYMPNGSLDYHLFGRGGGDEPLSWKRRLQICIDVARGLHYLHSGLKQPIIHRNVTPHHILLGQNWVAKLSDLGLSKIPKNSIKVDSTEACFGYVEPKYVATREVTEKTDIYSFGMVLFEMLSGRRLMFIEWVLSCNQNGTVDEIVDPDVKGQIATECLQMFVEIAKRCVLWDRLERPAMGEVQVWLEDALQVQEAADLTVYESHCYDATT